MSVLKLLLLLIGVSLATHTPAGVVPESHAEHEWVTPELVDSPQRKTDTQAFANVASKFRFQQHMPDGQVRASYDDRRRALPYGGMDFTMNPYRTPNSWHIDKKIQFFSPKVSNGLTFGPDPGLSLANIINSQHALLQASFNDGMRRMGLGYENGLLAHGFGNGGPGWGHFNRLQRPYGIDPYAPPFSYYSPPPLPSTTTVPDWSTAGGDVLGGSSSSSSSSSAGFF